jgi:PBSX family phage terminase large subunit
MPEIVIKAAEQFKRLYEIGPETNLVICIGGRGGMKSYEVSKFIAFSATVREKRCAILRDEAAKIRQSILNEILLRYDTANAGGDLDKVCRKLETGIKLNRTNNEVVFTMGFKASSKAKTAGTKSVSDVDIAVIEEAEDIREVYKYNAFADGIRKAGYLIIIVLNTPDLQHWISKRYFTAQQITFEDVPELKNAVNEREIEGYFNLIPRQIPGFLCIQTNYSDNPHLPENKVAEYENYGDPASHTYDLHYYLTAIKGYASSGRRGQILKKVKPITLAAYMALPFKEVYGQDFGTASPAGLVGVKFQGNNCYARQMNYLPMPVKEIGKLYCRLRLGPNDKIIGDSAEPDTIKKLRSGWTAEELSADERATYPALQRGFYIEGADKGPGSIQARISQMTGINLFAVAESTDLWNEINNWVYDTDKNGNPTDQPVDEYNHLIDPWAYVIKKFRGKGVDVGAVASMFG